MDLSKADRMPITPREKLRPHNEKRKVKIQHPNYVFGRIDSHCQGLLVILLRPQRDCEGEWRGEDDCERVNVGRGGVGERERERVCLRVCVCVYVFELERARETKREFSIF